MFQDVELYIPFATRMSPDAEALPEKIAAYLESTGLITSPENMKRYLSWQLEDLAGRFYPEARGDDMMVGALSQTFVFTFDDIFDGPVGTDPAAAYRICHEMARLVRRSEEGINEKPTYPIGELWLDYRRRCNEGMSAAWRLRTARHWEQYFLAYVMEATIRKLDAVLDVPTYTAMRRIAIGTNTVLATAEHCGHFEAPPEVHETLWLREVCEIAADVVTITNDLQSLEKDLRNNEMNNFVLLFVREHDCSERRAIEKLQELTEIRVKRFIQLESKADTLCRSLGIDAEGREGTHKFLGAARSLMKGNYDWGNSSDRYSATGSEYVKQSPYIDDRVSEGARML
ncbi:terpene synthase family protein [Streptomyces beigongshangae]|uniref:terpene synthase family protein n=1 Tax=Streptomyces beigongshangae TaxID=2841597 RepID=UPI001C85D72B|nr:hypothetical protein [Streptomyces sp. REN17]